MKISLGTDHAGFRYKEKVKALLTELGHEVKDFGTFNEEPVDYPVFIRPAAEAVARGECDRGIVFGGSGNAANAIAALSSADRAMAKRWRQTKCVELVARFAGMRSWPRSEEHTSELQSPCI